MVTTSKKDAQVQCALEACRILDAYGILRLALRFLSSRRFHFSRSNTRARLKRKTLQDNDFYDEDDDLYLDRTGELEKRRERRMQWAQVDSFFLRKRLFWQFYSGFLDFSSFSLEIWSKKNLLANTHDYFRLIFPLTKSRILVLILGRWQDPNENRDLRVSVQEFGRHQERSRGNSGEIWKSSLSEFL